MFVVTRMKYPIEVFINSIIVTVALKTWDSGLGMEFSELSISSGLSYSYTVIRQRLELMLMAMMGSD